MIHRSRVTLPGAARTLVLGTVAVLGSLLAPIPEARAQLTAQSAERAVFAAEPAAFAHPIIHCYRAVCKKYTGAFSSSPIWTHVTNLTRPPRTTWYFVCMRRSDGSYFYAARPLPPGRTYWATLVIPNGQWGWIQNWTVDFFPFQPLQFAHNTSRMADDGSLVNEAVGTVQIDYVPGLTPLTESVLHTPADTAPWAIDTVFGPSGAEVTFDDLGSDPLIDETVTVSQVIAPDFAEMTSVLDRNSDGSVDGSLVLTASGGLTGQQLSLRVFDALGTLEFEMDIDYQVLGTFSVATIETDSNGDGTLDLVETEELETVGVDTFISTSIDQGADGTIDQFEQTTLSYLGDFDASQTTEVFDAGGVRTEIIELSLSPFGAAGYEIDAQHDFDGDAIFETRELQRSTVGGFLTGTDVDEFSIDQDNDGVFDHTVTVVTEKSLSPTDYTETILSDELADGTIDASTVRIVDFGGGPIEFRRADANADGIIDIADPIWNLSFFFAGGTPPTCMEAGDANDDGLYNVADPIFLFDYIFLSGPQPPAPFPDCGPDPSPGALSCDAYGACP